MKEIGKTCGIITFHEVLNYGAILQNYALQKAIEAIEPNIKIETIDCKKDYFENKTKLISINEKDKLKSLFISLFLLSFKFIKKRRFKKFISNEINMSKKYSSFEEIGKYDALIVGSDQVWNPEITKYDSNLFLDFVSGADTKKISYAASIGNDKISDQEKKFIKNNIGNLDQISVRESSAVDVFNELGFYNITKVLDPTLLISKNEWLKLDKGNFNLKKYVLVYSLEKNVLLDKVANKVASRYDLEVIYMIPSKKKDFFKFNSAYGPYEFISIIKNASFIVTNSFHGTAFSVVFEKEFLTVPHKTRGTRMKGLLYDLDLRSRIIENESDESLSNIDPIDYKVVTSRLETMKKESIDFLRNAISF